MASERSYFIARRVHSITGVVPLGAYLGMHLFLNSFVLLGKGSFGDAVGLLHRMPYLPVIEWCVIYLPLAVHAAIGTLMVFEARYNTTRYGYSRNWWFWFQRVSAVIVALFIAWHVASTRIQLALGRVEVDGLHDLVRAQFQDPVFLAVYLVGVTAAAFHLGNGLWGFLVSWGAIVTRRSQKAWAAACIGLGALILAGFVNVAYHYASGSDSGGILPAIEGEPLHETGHGIGPGAGILD